MQTSGMLNFVLKLFGYDGDDPRVVQEFELTEDRTSAGVIIPTVNRRAFLVGLGATALTKAFSFPMIIKPVPQRMRLTPEILRIAMKQIQERLGVDPPTGLIPHFYGYPMGFEIPVEFSSFDANALAVYSPTRHLKDILGEK